MTSSGCHTPPEGGSDHRNDMLPTTSTEKPLPALYRVQGFDVALENRPEGIVATVVDVPGITATAETRTEVLNLIREQLAPLWKPSLLD